MSQPARPGGARAVAGIVLAGGRSRRFGTDKLAMPIEGRPLLEHALIRLAPSVSELIVAIAADAHPSGFGGAAAHAVVVRDPIPDGGPLVGLLSGLRATTAPVAVVVGGDMPLVAPALVRLLVEAVGAAESPWAAVLEEDGTARPLPSAFQAGRALPAAERLVASGERSLRSLLAALGATSLPEAVWRPLDPEGGWLLDLDTAADLSALQERMSRRPA